MEAGYSLSRVGIHLATHCSRFWTLVMVLLSSVMVPPSSAPEVSSFPPLLMRCDIIVGRYVILPSVSISGVGRLDIRMATTMLSSIKLFNWHTDNSERIPCEEA